MTYAESVELALAALGKATDALVFAIGVKNLAATSEYFVAIGLVSYIPDELVLRSIKNIVKCHGKFHYTQAGTEMTRIIADHVNYELAKL